MEKENYTKRHMKSKENSPTITMVTTPLNILQTCRNVTNTSRNRSSRISGEIPNRVEDIVSKHQVDSNF